MYRWLIVFFFFLLISGVWYSSCVKDTCTTTICANGGVCVNAVCACAAGYEGTNCEKKWNEKFIGVWQAKDSFYKSTSGRALYDLIITGGNTKDSFYVLGLADTLNDSLLLCVHNSPRGFTMKANNKLDSLVTIVSGSGMLDSATGIITGKYVFLRKVWTGNTSKDTSVTVGFTWRK